jgi:two-component system OmpR family response regulator
MRVAVIDDDPQQLELIYRFLSLEGFEVLTIKNEIGSVTNTARAFKPDVILVDLNMPHLPGVGLVRIMRREIPGAKIVVYSSDDATKIRKAQLETGAHSALSKSIDLRQLVNQIRSFEDA